MAIKQNCTEQYPMFVGDFFCHSINVSGIKGKLQQYFYIYKDQYVQNS